MWLGRRSGQLAESSYWQKQFQTISEDVSVRIQRIRGFTTMRYTHRLFSYFYLLTATFDVLL